MDQTTKSAEDKPKPTKAVQMDQTTKPTERKPWATKAVQMRQTTKPTEDKPKLIKVVKKRQTTKPTEDKPKLTIHYLRPGFEIPEPDEVKKCKEIDNNVYKLSSTIIVKHGPGIKFEEAKNMLFAEQNTTIPVPKVYAVYSHPIPDKLYYHPGEVKNYIPHTYIFMDLVPGATVQDSWTRWDEATKMNVQKELTDYIRQLRGIPGGDYIGSLDRGPVTDGALRFRAENCGPFDSEEEFNLELRKTYVKDFHKETLISERLDGMLAAHKHKIVFTHNDLHFTNIMIHDGHISGLIDWADSGWYPEYWEYTSSMRVMSHRDDWNAILDSAIGRPHCEFLMIERLRQVLFL